MIEDAIGYILGVCVGCILFLIYEVFNLYKKIERINIDINKLQILMTSLLPSSTGGRHGA